MCLLLPVRLHLYIFFIFPFIVSAYTELESAKAEEVEKLNDSVREKGLL